MNSSVMSVYWTYPRVTLLLIIWLYNILSHIQCDLITVCTVSTRLAMCHRAWRSCWFYSSFNHVSPLWYNQQLSTRSWFILTLVSWLNSSIWCSKSTELAHGGLECTHPSAKWRIILLDSRWSPYHPPTCCLLNPFTRLLKDIFFSLLACDNGIVSPSNELKFYKVHKIPWFAF